jgi:alpha-L-rhamnosidase
MIKKGLFLLVGIFSAFQIPAQVTVKTLLTENRTNPVGIDVTTPRFTWIAQDEKRNTVQQAYEIKVTTGKTVVWATGRVTSSQSVMIPYGGSTLESGKKYTWQVRVWDNFGKVSPWSQQGSFQMALLKLSDWKAKWIEPGYTEDPKMRPSPLMRKDFSLPKKVTSATLYVTAHGMYEAHINGQRVGDAYLTPGWTSYKFRVQYQTYDVTAMLKPGVNAIGIMLGNGWYRGIIGFSNNINVYGKDIALLCQLDITYNDGTHESVVSDDSWKSSTGEIRYSEIYNGETVDANKEQAGWTLPGFNDAAWSPVKVASWPMETLVATANETVKKKEVIQPVKLITTPKGETVLDFGQNLVGWVHMKVSGKKGDKVVLSHAEVLDKAGNFYTENLREARAQDTFILKGNGVEEFEPHFTWHGFRFLKLEGYPGTVDPANFKAIVLYSDMPMTGSFSSNSPLINQLQHNIQWGQKGNFLDVPTDCPQRDERLGWTGDAQVFSRTAAFNMNVNSFFAKWLKDLEADQVNGSVPFVVPNVLGAVTSSTGWADVATIVPWNMYLVYGDKRILEQQYHSMKNYLESIRHIAKNDLWNSGFHFGDWLFYRPDDDNDGRAAVTDKYLIAQCFYAHSTQLLINAATVLGNTEDAAFYTLLLGKIKEAFMKEYVTPSGRLVSGTQTAYVLALNFDMLPESLRAQAADRLADNITSYGNHLTTGFLGTPYLCHVLTRFGYNDLAYKLLFQETYPSWLYPVKQGATTIWERWDGQKPDGSFQVPSMNSFNHYSYGAIGDWMYRVVAGLDTYEDGVGYKHSLIKPQPGGSFSQVTAELATYYGTLSNSWKMEKDKMTMDVQVPFNTTATIYVPAGEPGDITEGGKPVALVEGLKVTGSEDGYVILKAGSGIWHFTAVRRAEEKPSEFSEYSGKYKVEGGMIDLIEVKAGQGKIRISAAGNEGELFPVQGEKDRFTAAGGTVVTFLRDETGRVETVRLEASGMKFEGKKE